MKEKRPYQMIAWIHLEVDTINCPIQRDEELFIQQEIKKVFDKTSIKLKNIFFL